MGTFSSVPAARRNPLRTSWRATIAAAVACAAITAFMTTGPTPSGPALLRGLLFTALAVAATVYILRTGRIYTPRLLLFVAAGLAFTAIFELGHELTRGSILLSDQNIESKQVPICPLTVGFTVPPLLLRGEMIFPSTVPLLHSVILFWVGFALLFGRGWCSWLCFFGWMDQTFAALGPARAGGRPLVEIPEIWLKYARLAPHALLLFLALHATATLYPLFCAWLCPLRIAYDPPVVTATIQWISAVIFVTLGLALLVVGPFLTRKRLFCSFGCPLLPLNAWLGLLSPFRVRVDRDRCGDCGLCTRQCPHGAITRESLGKGGTTLECSRCGKCLEVCPRGAIDFRLIGSNAPARAAFVALAVAFCIMFLNSYVGGFLHYLETGTVPPIGGA